MKSSLLLYCVYGILNLMILDVCLKYLFISIMEVDYFGVLIWSMICAIDLNDLWTRQVNFIKYYPHFEDKWLNFL